MPDEPVVVAPVTPPATPPATEPVVAPTTPPPTYFGSDGALSEGWQGTLDESLREDSTLKRFNNVNDLAKSYVSVRGMVGKDTIAVPTDTSPKDEWDSYHLAGGRPSTVADYNLKTPDGFPEELATQAFPEGRIAKWQERFFEGGVSQKAADSFIAEFAQDILADYQTVLNDEKTARDALVAGLAKDWGGAYDQNKHLSDMALTEMAAGDMELQKRLSDKFGSDPDFIRGMGTLGGKFAEGKPPGYAAVPTPNDLQAQIDELMASPILVDLKSTPLQRKQVTDKIMILREKMTPATV